MTTLPLEPARDWITWLKDALERREGERLQRQALRELVWRADVIAYVVLGAWGWVREALENEGIEARKLAGQCQVLLEGIDMSLAGHERLLEWAEADGLTPDAAGLRELEAKLPALREARPKVAEALALATRPPRPVDEKALAESQAALDHGKFVTVDEDYLARLRAGEDF
jgi:hypothetical protein